MGLIAVAVTVIVLGLVARAVAPSLGEKTASAKLASTGLMVAGLFLAGASTFVVIGVGEVGVKHFLGTINDAPLNQGVSWINPLANIERMSIREQSFPAGGGVEQIEAQTSEQMNVALEVSILYRILPQNAPRLFQDIGTEQVIKNNIVHNAVRNGVRDAVATLSINEIFSPDRAQMAGGMMQAIQLKAGDRIEVIQVFVRDIQAPQRVRESIEEKLEREQQVAAEKFQTEIIQERALQQVEEAKGIAEAQRLISAGLTQEYLTFFYIEQLAKLPPGSVVYVPTEGGVPLMRNIGGG